MAPVSRQFVIESVRHDSGESPVCYWECTSWLRWVASLLLRVYVMAPVSRQFVIESVCHGSRESPVCYWECMSWPRWVASLLLRVYVMAPVSRQFVIESVRYGPGESPVCYWECMSWLPWVTSLLSHVVLVKQWNNEMFQFTIMIVLCANAVNMFSCNFNTNYVQYLQLRGGLTKYDTQWLIYWPSHNFNC